MQDCIFCKIISGDIPCFKVAETDYSFAFLDNSPVNKGHLLVIPKEHHYNLLQTPDETLSDMILSIKRVGTAIVKILGKDDFSVFQRNGKFAGQEVPHLHFHVLPRFKGDGLLPWSGGKISYKQGEAQVLVDKIKQSLV